ncbi:CHAP domain-containing protein [Nonomuraea sp. LPB2021202275-12-8]|uniref:CHAP domain-containing protein n=1 Tax=Nonomuraea sp. LPB2021202275-12-8 TaxID=3120159 RepID=UPI00300C9149
MKKFIELLESELGYAEKAGAYTKFGSWYGKNVEFDADYTSAPWCDMLLSWAAHKLGYEEWMGQFAWTVAHAKWFRSQDAWGTEPQPGAFVFYDWSGSNSIGRIDHVGIVTRVEGGRIFTIEGNIDGGVAKRKERDTSKVVGYGYPWKIKERLDEKANRREGHQAEEKPAVTGPNVGTLQLPEQLSAEIPYVQREEQAQVPLTAPKTTPKKESRQAEAPAPSASSKAEAPATTSGTTTSPAVPKKSGKHAKHSTADTSAVTTGPIPVITDAVAATPPSAALGSPAILTSALVATLAVLAIAKTKRLRLRPALAGAPAPAAVPSHRRRRRKQAPPSRAAERTPRRSTVELAGTRRPLLDAAEPVTALKSLQRAATAAFPAFEPIVIPEATSEFDAFTRTPLPSSAPRPLPRPGQTTTGFEPFPLDPRATPFTHAGQATSGFEPFSRTPGAASEFDAFAPISASSRGGATASTTRREHSYGAYCGRRRRHEHPLEDPTGFVTQSPRGRRHRPSAVDRQFVEPFAQDTPLRGRRHRSSQTRSAHPDPQAMAMAGSPQPEGRPPAFGATPATASPPHQRTAPPGHGGSRTPSSRRGRHRA